MKYKDNFINFLSSSSSSSSTNNELNNTLTADKLNMLSTSKKLQIHKTEINNLTQHTNQKVNFTNKELHQDHRENISNVLNRNIAAIDMKDLFIGSLIININNALGWQDAWLECAVNTAENSITNHTVDSNDIHDSSFNKNIDSNNAVFDKNDSKCLNVTLLHNETNILASDNVNKCNIPYLLKKARQSVSFSSDCKQTTTLSSQSQCLDF